MGARAFFRDQPEPFEIFQPSEDRWFGQPDHLGDLAALHGRADGIQDIPVCGVYRILALLREGNAEVAGGIREGDRAEGVVFDLTPDQPDPEAVAFDEPGIVEEVRERGVAGDVLGI